MSDRREPYLIVRPTRAPTKAELRQGCPDNEAVVRLKSWNGEEYWFHLELAMVWPLELDG